MNEEDDINRASDWMRWGAEPEPREGDECEVCGAYWPRWVESRSAWLCAGCKPLSTVEDRCGRGEL